MKKSALKRLICFAIASVFVFSSNASIIAQENKYIGLDKPIFEEVAAPVEETADEEVKPAVREDGAVKLTSDMVESMLIRSTRATVNPNALDAQYEDNDTLATAYNWGSWSQYKSAIFGCLNDEGKVIDLDYYKYTVYASDGLKGRTGIRLWSLTEDYDLYLYRQNGTNSFTLIDVSENTGSQDEIVRTPEITSTTTYIALVLPAYVYVDDNGNIVGGVNDPNDLYILDMVANYTNTTTTVSLNPSSISSPGYGSWAPNATVNLTSNSSIPRSALLKGVTVTSSMSPSLGNTTLSIANASEGVWYDRIYSSSVTYLDLRERLEVPVKTVWYVTYNSQAWSTSRLSNLKLEISYYYDRYDN